MLVGGKNNGSGTGLDVMQRNSIRAAVPLYVTAFQFAELCVPNLLNTEGLVTDNINHLKPSGFFT
jgi:hypothetical protein